MTTSIRTAQTRVAVKIESSIGTDAIAGSLSSSDFITATCRLTNRQGSIPNPTYTSSYNRAAPIPGSLMATIEISMMMIGSGAAGTAPEWGKLLQICRMEEVVTGSAVGSPTAAASGTTTTVTAASPFGTTAQAYRGMPLLLAGNPSAGAIDAVLDYTTGRAITLGRTYGSALSTSTTLQVPVNVLYRETSDETAEKAATIYVYRDGLRSRLVGCRGSFRLDLPTGSPGVLTFTITGQVVDWDQAVSLPSGFTPLTRMAPVWKGGISQFNRASARVARLSFGAGVATGMPENPEATDAFDPPIITAAEPAWSIDPFSDTALSPTRFSAMRAGTALPLVAGWGAVAGNRFLASCPSAVVLSNDESERLGLRVDQINLAPDQPDAGFFLACY